MSKHYIRAHPESKLGSNYTNAHSEGWALVGFRTMHGIEYPIFRETFGRWFKRVVLRKYIDRGGD